MQEVTTKKYNKPFLKWAGNKYRLLEKIIPHLPSHGRLIEPFVGSGAVFLNTDHANYWLNDLNPDLTSLYGYLTQHQHDFIQHLAEWFTPENNTEKRYYQLRQQFNGSQDPYERSALFVYLNRHGYNGLCRYNQKGIFNVPFGRHVKPYFPTTELHVFLDKAKKIKLTQLSFQAVLQHAKIGDVIYCDPPYVPLSKTAQFTAYHQQPFMAEQQEELAHFANTLSQKGIPVVISNHDTPYTRKIYQGSQIIEFTAPRLISCNALMRKPVNELLAIYT